MPSVRSDWVILSNWSGVISTWKLPTNGLVSVFVSLVIHAVTFSNILDLLISGKVRTSIVHWAAPHASKRCLILSKWSYIGIFQMPSYSNFVLKHFQCPNETDGNAITSSIYLLRWQYNTSTKYLTRRTQSYLCKWFPLFWKMRKNEN